MAVEVAEIAVIAEVVVVLEFAKVKEAVVAVKFCSGCGVCSGCNIHRMNIIGQFSRILIKCAICAPKILPIMNTLHIITEIAKYYYFYPFLTDY